MAAAKSSPAASSLPAEDTYDTGSIITKRANRSGNLTVNGNHRAFVRFDIADLPWSDSADVVSAKLRFYLSTVNRPGVLTVHEVTEPWTENSRVAQASPSIDLEPAASVLGSSVIAKRFVTVDVTALVKQWLDDPSANDGIAIVSDGTAKVQIGSKEGSGSGYPAELEIETAGVDIPDGSITADKLASGFMLPISAIPGIIPGAAIQEGSIAGTQIEVNPTLQGVVNATGFNGSGAWLTDLSETEVKRAQFFDWVEIGHPNNAPDPLTGFGAVPVAFHISKFEVTNLQYAEFLNSVATADPNGLYHPSMGTDPSGGIARCGTTDGSYTYVVKKAMADKPVNFVGWFDTLRFCNWLHNGRPKGPQGPTTTEDGAYAITGSGNNSSTTGRKVTAKYWLPSENEWYKAAYFDPTKDDGAGGYRLYATGLDTAPSTAEADGVGNIVNRVLNVANHSSGADWNGRDGNVTTVGSGGPGAESVYGVADIGGNVWEWDEAIIGGNLRGLRGGCWNLDVTHLISTYRHGGSPVDDENHVIGFRVAKP